MKLIYISFCSKPHSLFVSSLHLLGLLLIVTANSCGTFATAEETRPSRFIYNSDANHMYYYKTPPMNVDDLYEYVDEVVGTGVTTFFASPNWGMKMSYPSKVTEMIGSDFSKEKLANFCKAGLTKEKSAERAFANYYALYHGGHDPFGLMIERAREKKLEVFISHRPNEVHDVQNADSLVLTKFWQDHPEWRVGKIGDKISPAFVEIIGGRKDYRVHPIVASWFPGALNFAYEEVRKQRLAELRECCERYPIDGLDVDFQRFPIYFPQDEGPKHKETMTAWMREVRAMTNEIGIKRGRPLLLSVRVMARPEQNHTVGLDPIAWAQENLVDFITVAHFLRNDFPLPIKKYRELMPETLPIYASIEVENKAETFRRIARELHDEGADGLMMFNYFSSRCRDEEPDFALFKELSQQ